MPETSFRTAQALSDLRSIAVSMPGLRMGTALGKLILDRGCRLGADNEMVALITRLEALAASPDAASFAPATAVMLADCLQGGRPPSGLLLNWECFSDEIRTLPIRERVALCTGFQRLGVRLGENDLVSTDCAAIVDALIGIARAMTPGERIHIAKSERHSDWRKHLAALEAVIDRQNCRITSEQLWYPSEAVELTSHVPANTGFAGATAILMINALEDGDDHDHMDFRWMMNSTDYFDLPAGVAGPILAGFRHLYESVEVWDPYFVAPARIRRNAVVIPPASTQFLLPARAPA